MFNPIRGRRRLLVLAVVAAGLAVLAVVTIRCVIPWHRHGRIVALAAEFNANPTQETADQLCAILDAGTNDEDADLILRTLIDPKVVLEQHYYAGAPITVHLASGNKVDSLKQIIVLSDPNAEVSVEDPDSPGKPIESTAIEFDKGLSSRLMPIKDSSDWGLEWRQDRSKSLVLPGPGVYRGVVKTTFLYWRVGAFIWSSPPPTWTQRTRAWLASFFTGGTTSGFRCHFEIPVEIHVEDAPAQPPPVQ